MSGRSSPGPAPAAPPLPVPAARGRGGGRREGRNKRNFLRPPVPAAWGWGQPPAGSPSAAGTPRAPAGGREGEREEAAARARRAAERQGRGEEAALLLPAPCTDIHYTLYIHIEILMNPVYTRSGAARPAPPAPTAPPPLKKPQRPFSTPKAHLPRQVESAPSPIPLLRSAGRVLALPGEGEPGTGRGGARRGQGAPHRPLAEEPPLAPHPRLAQRTNNAT